MKKNILTIAFGLLLSMAAHAQLYSTQNAQVSFFSATPVEDIEANCKTVIAVLNTATGDMAFQIINTSFEFKNKLMEEHFNEKYMESDKFPKSTFKGKINEKVDFTKDGEYNVTVTGKLAIHGVEQDRVIPGKVIVKDGKVQLLSTFQVKNADHKIEIPSIVSAKIAESLEVKVNASMMPKK